MGAKVLVRDYKGRIINKIEAKQLHQKLSRRIRKKDIIDTSELQEEQFRMSCYIRFGSERITVDFWLIVKKQDNIFLINIEPVSKKYIRTLAFAVATYITQKLEKQDSTYKLKGSRKRRKKDIDTFPIYLQKADIVGKYLKYNADYIISLYRLVRVLLRYFRQNPFHIKHSGTRVFTLEAA